MLVTAVVSRAAFRAARSASGSMSSSLNAVPIATFAPAAGAVVRMASPPAAPAPDAASDSREAAHDTGSTGQASGFPHSHDCTGSRGRATAHTHAPSGHVLGLLAQVLARETPAREVLAVVAEEVVPILAEATLCALDDKSRRE